MTSNSDINKRERREALAVERRRILEMAPEKALAAVIEHPYPVTLVQSFKEEDLFLLVHTIGPNDALPVLALASNAQWEHFLDMEIWNQDKMDQRSTTQWLDLLLKADSDRFIHWISRDKLPECEFYFFKNIEVRIRENDQDTADFEDDFHTVDGTFYVRPRKVESADDDSAGEPLWIEERNQFLSDLIRRLSISDPMLYRNILLEVEALIPAETEEELYRLRNIRMAEKGFLPFEEAVGVYQALSVPDLLKRARKPETGSGRLLDAHPLRVDPVDTREDANLFTRTLVQLHDEAQLHRLQAEFAGLCNQIIAADQLLIRDKESLARVVRKTGDYISLGMEAAAAETKADPYQHANLILTYLLADIFRVGYGCALALKWKAEKWRRSSWFSAVGLPLTFWGETWMGVLGGLLIKKPFYYDNYAHGVLYREFRTLSDIRSTGQVLETINAFDDLLALMKIAIVPSDYTFLTYQNLLLTMWANHHLGMSGRTDAPQPLTLDHFRRLFAELWKSADKPRRISDPIKKFFLDWLSQRSGIDPLNISQRMGAAVEKLFSTIEAELGQVDPDHLDLRHIYLFLFARKPKPRGMQP